MTNTAILVGNSQYQSLRALSCCHDDLMAMRELLEATAKYSEIEVIEDTEADELKSKMRAVITKNQSLGELFFYFTGHGWIGAEEFYYCATNFDSKRPNVTGLSTDELHTLLRQANADVVVKVIDACNSGTLLIKKDGDFLQQENHVFKNLIQISSCLESQNALTGKPLSIFTEKFRTSALCKSKGIVYYTDIINTLRDEFLQNNEQTPLFVSQVTGREQFVDDAKRLDNLRAKLEANTESSLQSDSEDRQAQTVELNLETLLEGAEKNVATPEKIASFANILFDSLIEKVSKEEFSEFFDLNSTEHSDFREPTAEAFIIRVLLSESRSDEFVTAKIRRERARNPLEMISTMALLGMFGDDQRYREVYDLSLNCNMQRAQLRITFTPKYNSLKQLILVVTCAPSLGNCYVFEICSQHSLTDFGEFDVEGNEVVRRWYKFQWSENPDTVVAKIASKLAEIVREHLEHTKQRLTKE